MPRAHPPEGVREALDVVARELYATDPEDFIATRDARALSLRADGSPVLARAVKALRRPTQGAWLVNLLVRERGEVVEDLLALGEAMRDADLDAATLKQLSVQRRQVVDALVRDAARLGGERGVRTPADVRGDVQSTLEAALLDPEVAAAVRSGRLDRAAVRAGFPAAAPRPTGPASPSPAREREEQRRRTEERRAAEAAVRAAERAVDVARRAAGSAAEAQARHDEVLARLREQLVDAQRRAAEQALEARTAAAELARREEALAAARAALDPLTPR